MEPSVQSRLNDLFYKLDLTYIELCSLKRNNTSLTLMEHSQKLTIYVVHKNLNKYQKAEITQTWGAGVAQLVKHPALDFSSYHDIMVQSPHWALP